MYDMYDSKSDSVNTIGKSCSYYWLSCSVYNYLLINSIVICVLILFFEINLFGIGLYGLLIVLIFLLY